MHRVSLLILRTQAECIGDACSRPYLLLTFRHAMSNFCNYGNRHRVSPEFLPSRTHHLRIYYYYSVHRDRRDRAKKIRTGFEMGTDGHHFVCFQFGIS